MNITGSVIYIFVGCNVSYHLGCNVSYHLGVTNTVTFGTYLLGVMYIVPGV